MKSNTYQKLAISALVSVLVLIFVGAIVRVTGAGMGCPDWPTCWGMLIPPTSLDQVDFTKLDIERFQRKAERMGRDPSSISEETLRKDFNPRHVWTEFINRLFGVTVGLVTFATFIAAHWQRKERAHIYWLSFAALLLVLANAVMGAMVVFSGIAPGILSLHLGLAMLLICVLTYCVWAGTPRPQKVGIRADSSLARKAVIVLLIAVVAEGILGAQIREMTDKLSKSHINIPRETWIGELEQSAIYVIHRSFSWAILFTAAYAFVIAKRNQPGGATPTQIGVVAIMLAQMLLGLVMSQIHIYSWAQVLHVGLAAILLSLVFRWLLITPKGKRPPAEANGR